MTAELAGLQMTAAMRYLQYIMPSRRKNIEIDTIWIALLAHSTWHCRFAAQHIHTVFEGAHHTDLSYVLLHAFVIILTLVGLLQIAHVMELAAPMLFGCSVK